MIGLSGSKELFVIQSLQAATRERDYSLQSLASGRRARLAPAELVLATQLQTQVDSIEQAIDNVESAENLSQVAQGSLQQAQDNIREARRLAVAAANTGVYDVEAREALQAQVQAGVQAAERFMQSAALNNGQFQIGPDPGQAIPAILTDPASVTTPLQGITVLTEQGSYNAMQATDAARVEISRQSARIGSLQADTLRPAARSLRIRQEALMRSHSTIADTDFARETTRYIQKKILVESGITVISRAVIARQRALATLP
ncbi:MAG: flagellin [Chloroherpetonaceae bacterium]|nr:flagellin [Chthonomonadaceae bacterium]MDW8207523.1 flagellin [Chloroherpetonaceae bacterium]